MQGIRTVIATNSQPTTEVQAEGARNNETWVYYPDDLPARSFYRGDSRAALAPFLAHKELGDTYKWMVYGDKDFDPDLPWFITGNAPTFPPCILQLALYHVHIFACLLGYTEQTKCAEYCMLSKIPLCTGSSPPLGACWSCYFCLILHYSVSALQLPFALYPGCCDQYCL